MKKNISLVFASLVLVLLFLSACGTTSTMTDQNKSEDVKTEVKFATYTQYDSESGACLYYFSSTENCYVPLGFCTPDPSIKKEQTLDKDKYCSDTPDLSLRSLRTGTGACPFTATEGDLINLKSIAADPDEQDPKHKFGPLGKLVFKFSEPFSDSNGIWQTQDGDAGIVPFKVTVTDGEYIVSKDYCIEVLPGNRPPFLTNLDDVRLQVGQVIKLNPICTDPDQDTVFLSYQGNFIERFWMTSDEKLALPQDIGQHQVTVICTDPFLAKDAKTIIVTVVEKGEDYAGNLYFTNLPESITIREGETVKLAPVVNGTDPARKTEITYIGWMDGPEKTADYTDAGAHYVTVTAADGVATISKTITINVINVNRPPEIVSTSA